MGYFKDTTHNFCIYDAPKGGGTTLRLWIEKKYFSKINSKKINGDYITQSQKSYGNLKYIGYTTDWYTPTDLESVCIKRDPVDRFKSCFLDKVIREKKCGNKVELNSFIDNFDHFMNRYNTLHADGNRVPYIYYHFAPQCKQFGTNISYYTEVFDISEMNTKVREYLMDKWHIEIPMLHARKNNSNKLILSPSQEKKIRKLYEEDYDTGWC